MDSKLFELDTELPDCPDQFATEWVQLRGLSKYPLFLRHELRPKGMQAVHLFGRGEFCRQEGAQIFLELYPAATSHEKLKLYVPGNFKIQGLPAKSGFDDLFVPKFSGYEHSAHLSKDGAHRKRICHSFKNDQQSVLVVYSLNSADFLACDFFKKISAGIQILP